MFKTFTKLNDSVNRNIEQLQSAMLALAHDVSISSWSEFRWRDTSSHVCRSGDKTRGLGVGGYFIYIYIYI